MSKSTESNDSPTDTDSVEPVSQRFQFDLNGVAIQFNTIKCGQCKVVTPHQWLMVPVGTLPTEPPMDQLELNELAKRLILCQNCGTMRLIK